MAVLSNSSAPYGGASTRRGASGAKGNPMYEWLHKTLVTRLNLPQGGITPQATPEEAGLDSLAVTELVMVLKDELGVTVDEDELYELRTIGDIAAFLEARSGSGARGEPVVR